MVLTEEMDKVVSGKLKGGAELGGMDAIELQQLLSARGSARTHLRCEVARFVEWMSNNNVPWAAITGFMYNQLIALDKLPGIRPVGIGEI